MSVSPIPSRSSDPDPHQPNTRYRSASAPKSSNSSLSVAQVPVLRRSQTPKGTPKAKRKIVSSRPTPYSLNAVVRSNRSSTARTTFDLSDDEADGNFNALSINSTVNRSEPRQGEPCQPRDPFEKSFDESDQKREQISQSPLVHRWLSC
jgi:hypothetical protein